MKRSIKKIAMTGVLMALAGMLKPTNRHTLRSPYVRKPQSATQIAKAKAEAQIRRDWRGIRLAINNKACINNQYSGHASRGIYGK